MNIVVLVYGPDFASSENLKEVFKAWGNVDLISYAPSDWRNYDNGLLANTPASIERAKAIMANSDLIVLGDATSVLALSIVSPNKRWLSWARSRRIMAFFGDTAYHKYFSFYDGIVADLNARLFLLPNLIDRATIPAIPLHHPMVVEAAPKSERLSIAHAPGRELKAQQKGTEVIEMVIARLQEEFDFDYRRLMMLPIKECLELKASAHVVIDQLPPKGAIRGLGRTGTEALAVGSTVLSTMYEMGNVVEHFPPPPVVGIVSEGDLQQKLKTLLENPQRIAEISSDSLEWAREYLAYDKWLQYIGRYL